MPFKIETDHDDQIIILRVSGEEPLDKHIQQCERTIQECCDSGFKKILIDLRALNSSNITSTETGIWFGKFFADDERLKDVQIAQVLPMEILSRVDVDFSASIAEIKGKTIGRFTTIEEAKGWLKEQ
jgi:hypothetical protein